MGKQERKIRPTAFCLFCLTGALLVFCCLTGSGLAARGNLVWTGAYTVRTLAVSLLGGGVLGAGLCVLLAAAGARKRPGKAAFERWQTGAGKLFCVSLLLIVLAWLPTYLAYFPAVCSYDMPIQTGQVAEHYYIDHHPIAHTFLLKCFMQLGEKALGSVTGGIGIFALLQLVFLAGAFACGVTMLYRRGTGCAALLLVQAWCMLYPFHWYMGVSITKDTVFTGFFVLQMLCLCELADMPEERHRLRTELGFFTCTVGMILFRNNGKYAVLVLLAVLLAALLTGRKARRYFARLLLWSVGAFLTGTLLLSAIFRFSGAEQGDRREMLSMPIQQMARTMLYHGGVGELPEDDNTMGEADRELVNAFLLNESYRSYRPDISDPVKSNTNTYVVRYRAKDFLTTYLRLFAQYPGDYLNAALAVNAGYLYPGDITHAYVNVVDERPGRGYVQTYWEEDTMNARGIYKASCWEWLLERLERWADENAYLKLPVLKYLFVPGVWLWLYLFLLAYLVLQRRYRQCIPLALAGGYFATLLLGPTVQLRYIYPLMAAFPFVLLATRERKEENDEGLQG